MLISKGDNTGSEILSSLVFEGYYKGYKPDIGIFAFILIADDSWKKSAMSGEQILSYVSSPWEMKEFAVLRVSSFL